MHSNFVYSQVKIVGEVLFYLWIGNLVVPRDWKLRSVFFSVFGVLRRKKMKLVEDESCLILLVIFAWIIWPRKMVIEESCKWFWFNIRLTSTSVKMGQEGRDALAIKFLDYVSLALGYEHKLWLNRNWSLFNCSLAWIFCQTFKCRVMQVICLNRKVIGDSLVALIYFVFQIIVLTFV